MAIYIHATGNTIIKYPFSRSDLSIAYPNVSFAANPTAEDLAPFDIYPVSATPRPADTRTERTVEAEPIITADGWQQVWTVRDATEEEIAAWDIAHRPEPEWMAFGLVMATSTAIAALYAALPVPVANALSIGLSDAAKGDDRLFAGLWQQVAAGGAISAELLAEITAAAEQHHLPQSFIDSLQFSNEV